MSWRSQDCYKMSDENWLALSSEFNIDRDCDYYRDQLESACEFYARYSEDLLDDPKTERDLLISFSSKVDELLAAYLKIRGRSENLALCLFGRFHQSKSIYECATPPDYHGALNEWMLYIQQAGFAAKDVAEGLAGKRQKRKPREKAFCTLCAVFGSIP
jgi:hypothetical protein